MSRSDAEYGRVLESARGWIGTPYHHQASVRGVGCDCLGLIRGVWRELYGTEPPGLGPYTGDWAEATGNEALLLAARRHLTETAITAARPGDVLIFRLQHNAVAKHAGVLAGEGRMIHAQEGVPVSEVHLGAWWRRHIAAAFVMPDVSD